MTAEIVTLNNQIDSVKALRAASLAVWRLGSILKELKLLNERERNETIDFCDAINLWHTLSNGGEEAVNVLEEVIDALDPYGRHDLKRDDDPKSLEKAYDSFLKIWRDRERGKDQSRA